MMQVAICFVIPQCMHLSCTIMEIWRLKDNGVMTLTFWCHVTSSVTWLFDSWWVTSYGWSIVYLAPLSLYGHLKFFREGSSRNGDRSILNITLISYTLLRYVGKVARKE